MSYSKAVLKALLLAAGAPSVAGHAYLAEPASRNLLAQWAGTETCAACLQSGGPDNVRERAQGMWPTKDAPKSHGLCGNPVQGHPNPVSLADETYLVQGEVQRTYTAGEIVTFRIGVSAHHKGHYEFRICDHGLDRDTLGSWQEGQDCLNEWLLERAPPMEDCVPNDSRGDCQPLDEQHPERWYLPPHKKGTQSANASWSDSDATLLPAIGEVHSMRYKIPESLSCEHCTLQWYYSTGNSCLYDGGYISYFKKMAELGWSASEWVYGGMASWVTCENSCCGPSGTGAFGEEFWNCADIAVLPSGQGVATSEAPVATTSSESSATSATTTPASSATTSTTPATTAATTSSASSGACAEEWGQCGGQDWTGSTCCASGLKCVRQTVWFSICEHISAVEPQSTTAVGSTTAASTPAPVTTSAAPATTAIGTCAGPWEQCGGNGWTGTTCCASGYFCNALSEWHSQCDPVSRRLNKGLRR